MVTGDVVDDFKSRALPNHPATCATADDFPPLMRSFVRSSAPLCPLSDLTGIHPRYPTHTHTLHIYITIGGQRETRGAKYERAGVSPFAHKYSEKRVKNEHLRVKY